jgi:hypothetical protein
MSKSKKLCESMTVRGFLVTVSWLLSGGCASVFPPGDPVELTETQRAGLRAFPGHPYEMEQSVVLSLRGKDFPGLGITRILPGEGSFAASCLTAQGLTVFDIAGQGDRLDVCRTLPDAGDPQVVGQAFARNIQCVYFGNLPDPQASWWRDGESWTAVSALPDGGTLRHRFMCANGRLTEKCQFTRRGRLAWSVTFKDYDETGPCRIELIDRTLRWPYELTIRIQAWHRKGEP